MENQAQSVNIEGRKKIAMTGVESVDAFSENRIVLTIGGTKVTIEGTHLKVLAFSQGSGNFSASGEVGLLRYGMKKGKVGNLFK